MRGYGETSAVVAAKIAAALQLKHGDGSHKLRVIACVGETLEERQAGNTMQVSFVTDFVASDWNVTLHRWCSSSFRPSNPASTLPRWSSRIPPAPCLINVQLTPLLRCKLRFRDTIEQLRARVGHRYRRHRHPWCPPLPSQPKSKPFPI